MSEKLMIYGAYGYTGELIAAEAQKRGLTPVIAGRDPEKLAAIAQNIPFENRCFALDNADTLDQQLDGIEVVLNCAGPFARTAQPMAEACIRRGAHYLDITGEIPVFEAMSALHDQAAQAGSMLMPGVGFDVVPTDCLAVFLKDHLPAATHLALAFHMNAAPSHGTTVTILENMPKGASVRVNGKLQYIRKYVERTIPFESGPHRATRLQWGDAFTAWKSTGIPNIEIFITMPPTELRLIKYTQWLLPLMGFGPINRLLTKMVKPGGPNEEARAREHCELWGEAKDDEGNTITAQMRTPESYNLTVDSALQIAQRVLADELTPGYTTPAKCYGAQLIESLSGTTMHLV